MSNRIVSIRLIVVLIMIFLLAGCSPNEQNTSGIPPTGLVTNISSAEWVSQRPKLALPCGVDLTFETVEVDRLPMIYNSFVYAITSKPNFADYNNKITYNLYPETQSILAEINYAQYFVIMAAQGHREYNKSGIQIEQVMQNGNTVNIIANMEDDTTHVHSLITTSYQIIKIDKTQLTQYGYLIQLFDQTGFLNASAYATIPDIKPVTTATQTNLYNTTNCIPPPPPVSCKLELSQLPKVGDSTELTFNIYDEDGITDSQGWIEFYWTNIRGSYLETKCPVQVNPQDILVSGEASWQLNSPENNAVTLNSTIHFPEEGIWEIRGFFYNNDNQLFTASYKVAVKKDGAIDVFKIYKSKDFADIENLLRGEPGETSSYYMSDYNKSEPVVIELDLPKAPTAGENVKVTCRIVSLHKDIPNYVAHIALWKRVLEQPDEFTTFIKYVDTQEKEYYVSGILLWQGSLKQNQAMEFSATIFIPENGEWEIYAGGDLLPTSESINDYGLSKLLNNYAFSKYKDSITLTVTEDNGSYGYPLIEIGGRLTGRQPSLSRNWIGVPSYSAASSSITVPAAKP